MSGQNQHQDNCKYQTSTQASTQKYANEFPQQHLHQHATDSFADIFADFEPYNTTDGSYRGTMAKIKATELHYQEVFEQKLAQANSNLKRDRVRVRI
ncbi:MAG: hypothetical protein QNJ51_17455, partial [Calothrix sp. MO_167.B12]|nr:hypothetical protein [Calothrix sp. MO_167.B12]